jgi:hypothetical protein
MAQRGKAKYLHVLPGDHFLFYLFISLPKTLNVTHLQFNSVSTYQISSVSKIGHYKDQKIARLGIYHQRV